MKKLLLLAPIFLTGCVSVNDTSLKGEQGELSYHCEQQYEEINGYKIGCPLNTKGMLQKPSKDANVSVFTKKIQGAFFDKVEAKILDGKLEELSFIKVFQPSYEANKDMKALVDALKERWGKYQLIDFGTTTKTKAYAFRNPRGKILYHIMATQMYDRSIGIIDVTYTSNIMNAYSKKKSDNDAAQRTRSFKGY